MTQSFQVTTQRADGTGGPVVEVDGIADNRYDLAATAGLAATGVASGGGDSVSFVHLMDTGHAGRLGQATESTLSAIAGDVAALVPLATALPSPPALTATAVADGNTDAQGVAAAANLRLFGYSVQETNSATAQVILRNGTTDSSPILAYISLAADEEKFVWFGERGIAAASGIFVERVSGDTALVLYNKAVA